MICKKDVITWFKELESYRRIDMMCTLLNMCLPFELRFLGTCLEELGRRDSQELRGIELRVNNPQDLAADMMTCQKGEPTDKKIRRKMALYLALIRACNRTCVAEIFRTLDSWGDRDFSKMNDADTLQELLLVYTMAANHPVFSFEQHMKCTEIFEKIKENKLVSDEPPAMVAATPDQQNYNKNANVYQQRADLRPNTPLAQQDLTASQQALANAASVVHLSNQHQPMSLPILTQMQLPVNFPHAHLAKLMPNDVSMQNSISLESAPQMLPNNVSMSTDAAAASHPGPWAVRTNMQQHIAPSSSPSNVDMQSQSSPMLSQQSSPSSSRASSPNRAGLSGNTAIIMPHQLPHHQLRNAAAQRSVSLKNVNRASAGPETSMGGHQQIMLNENTQQFATNPKQMDDIILNSDGTMMQLQTLVRNGYSRNAPHQRQKGGNQLMSHQHVPVGQNFQAVPANNFPGLTFAMQNMVLLDGTGVVTPHSMDPALLAQNRNKTAGGGSDSGSSISSSGEVSPPETPTQLTNDTQQQPKQHMSYKQQLNLSRLNGRQDKLIFVPSTSSNTQQQQQSTFVSPNDILLPSPGSGGANQGGILPQSLDSSDPSNTNAGNSNNNMVGNNPVLISSTSSGLPQAFNSNSFPYHTSSTPHLSTATRTPIIAHNPALGAPPPGGSFRISGFQVPPPKTDMIFTGYHSTGGLAFLGAPPHLGLRSTNATSANATPPNNLQSIVSTPQTPSVPSSQFIGQPYAPLPAGSVKPVSCYNCGSQAHNGRDCHEASMDDVTRSAIYKLDYSASASASNLSPTGVAANATQSAAGLRPPEQSSQQAQQKHGGMGNEAGAGTNVGTTNSSTASATAP